MIGRKLNGPGTEGSCYNFACLWGEESRRAGGGLEACSLVSNRALWFCLETGLSNSWLIEINLKLQFSQFPQPMFRFVIILPFMSCSCSANTKQKNELWVRKGQGFCTPASCVGERKEHVFVTHSGKEMQRHKGPGRDGVALPHLPLRKGAQQRKQVTNPAEQWG